MKLAGTTKRGGKRPGSGQKKAIRTYSDRVRAAWFQAAKKLAKEHGVTVEEKILSLIYDPKFQSNAKAGIAKVYCDVLVVKETHSVSEHTERRVVELPAVQQKPPEAELTELPAVGMTN